MANDVGLLQSSSPNPWAPVGIFDSITAPQGAKPTITSSTQRNGKVGAPYSTTLTASGDAPITWAVSSGSLPDGITLTGDKLVGTPTVAGTWIFWIRATNNIGADEDEYTFVVSSDVVAPVITTTFLPAGRIGVPYQQTLRADGAVPIQWSTSGSPLAALGLPGITSPGVIGGTPTSPGRPVFDVRAENVAGFDVKSLSLLVPNEGIGGNAPAVTTVTLVPATATVRVGTTADVQVTVEDQDGDGIPNMTGTLVIGDASLLDATFAADGLTDAYGQLTVSLQGKIEGSTTVRAVFDGVTSNVSNVTIGPAIVSPVITTAYLPDAVVGEDYSQTLVATGATPITWAVTAGALPAGLLLIGDTISGRATSAETATFTITATNVAGSGVAIFTITSSWPLVAPSIVTATLPSAVIGQAYSNQISATGTAPITWSVVSGAMPAGLTLGSNGLVSGTATVAGAYNFVVRAENMVGAVEKAFSIAVNTLVVAPTITTTQLPNGKVGDVYQQTLQATGSGTITWKVSAGFVPAGLVLNQATGAISGTPSAEGTATFTVTATNTGGSYERTLTITVDVAVFAPVITTTALSATGIGSSYSETLVAVGTAPISWSLASGSTLPAGLVLNGDKITGTPTVVGTFFFTVTAANGVGSDSRQLSVAIAAIVVRPKITTTSLPPVVVGQPYMQTLGATGSAPITWSINGALPAGLTLSNNVISGTPTAAGAQSFVATATNSAGADTVGLSITVSPVGVAPTITTTSLPSGMVGAAYGKIITATGDAPIVWSILGGALPNGLTLNASTGLISGTPSEDRAADIIVRAANGAGAVDRVFTLIIAPIPVYVDAVLISPAAATLGENQTWEFRASVVGSGGPSQIVAWSVVGQGSITQQGLYTPAGPGTATIVATSVQDPSRMGRAAVDVVDVTAPLVTMTATSLPPGLPGSIVLEAKAVDNTGVVKVIFYRDGVQIGPEMTAEPWRRLVTFATADDNGTFAFAARAYDADGNSTLSSPAMVTVNIAIPYKEPTPGLNQAIEIPRKDTTRGFIFKLTSDGVHPLSGVVPRVSIARNDNEPIPVSGTVVETSIPGTYLYVPSEPDVNVEGTMMVAISANGAAPVKPIRTRVVTPYGKR